MLFENVQIVTILLYYKNDTKIIQVCDWSDELQQNYNDCIKLTKVKKIHNFMLNDFREIFSQHHNMVAYQPG